MDVLQLEATEYSGTKRESTNANACDALFAIADALNAIAIQLKWLGTGDAATRMGAVEAHAVLVGEKLERGLDAIASAIEHHGEPQ